MSRNKKQLDKESMFKKIMPSAAESGQSTDIQPTESAANDVAGIVAAPPFEAPVVSVRVPEPLPAPALESAPVPKPAPEPEPVPVSASATTSNSVAASSAPLSASAAVQPEDSPTLVNLVRTVLESKMDAALEKFHCCTCECCRLDILAIALNKTKPQYVILNKDAPSQPLISSALSRDATTALIQAIMLVKAHPHH